MNDIKERTDKVKHDTLHYLSNLYMVARGFINETMNISDKKDTVSKTNKLYKLCKDFITEVDKVSLKMIIGEQGVKSLKEMRDKAKELK